MGGRWIRNGRTRSPSIGQPRSTSRSSSARTAAISACTGSINLAQFVLSAGLVDELRLVVSAAIAGSGRRPFDGVGRHLRLELAAAEHTPSGTLLLTHSRHD
ncbi:dihydrofolate reductase family protein [Occultella aeris]|uniref:dihydrofolate reductase family protein n=1 Tax=Occultella aeris TaxID=2761496 RepID=UPI0012E9DBE6